MLFELNIQRKEDQSSENETKIQNINLITIEPFRTYLTLKF